MADQILEMAREDPETVASGVRQYEAMARRSRVRFANTATYQWWRSALWTWRFIGVVPIGPFATLEDVPCNHLIPALRRYYRFPVLKDGVWQHVITQIPVKLRDKVVMLAMRDLCRRGLGKLHSNGKEYAFELCYDASCHEAAPPQHP